MLWHDPSEEPTYSQVLELDLSTVEPSLAGPRRPQDRVPLTHAKTAFLDSLGTFGVANALTNGSHDKAVADTFPASDPTSEQAPGGSPEPEPDAVPVAVVGPGRTSVPVAGTDYELEHGSVVIAAITSCTNTSNPQVMVGAGLLAKKAVERGLRSKPWVKTSLAPGSKVVTEYYDTRRADAVPRAARLPHRRLRLHDLHRQLRAAAGGDLGRGREGRPRRLLRALGQPQLRGPHPPGGEGELPRLAAARRRLRARGPDGPRPARGAARRGRGRQRRLPPRPLAERSRDPGDDRRLRARRDVPLHVRGRLHRRRPVARAAGARGRALRLGAGLDLRPPAAVLRRTCRRARSRSRTSTGARCLVMLGDSVTTDHISPAGSIKPDSPGRART